MPFHYQKYLPKIKDYAKWKEYCEFIIARTHRDLDKFDYLEEHHIIPKSFLPKDMDLKTTFVKNKCMLTGEEHLKAHKLLKEALVDNPKMDWAYKEMRYVDKYGRYDWK